MAFAAKLQDGEVIEQDIDLVISKKPQLRLVLTNRAAYWPEKKAFAVSDPIVTRRAALEHFLAIHVGRTSRLTSVLIGGLIASGGGFWLVGQFFSHVNHVEIKWPLLMLVGGLFFCLAGGHRRQLTIELRNAKGLRWTSPAAIGGGINEQVDGVLAVTAEWAASHSINVKRVPAKH